MRAIVCQAYGPPEVLQLAEVPRPSPKPSEVLVRVRATTATPADTAMRRGDSIVGRALVGFRRPRTRFRILGLELAGEVEQAGAAVTRFRPGDRVYAFAGFRPGAYAEYICLPETGSIAAQPATMTPEEAASVVDGATTALVFLRDKARIRIGDRVLINGASGSMGTAAVQLAKHFGAHVTGVCGPANQALVASLGADRVIDYTARDFTRAGDTYDIIFDVASASSFARCRDSPAPGGRYIVTVQGWVPVLQSLWTRVAGDRRVIFAWSLSKAEPLAFLRELIDAGQFRAVIDRRYSLEQVADAHRYVEAGHKRGSVVITVAGAPGR